MDCHSILPRSILIQDEWFTVSNEQRPVQSIQDGVHCQHQGGPRRRATHPNTSDSTFNGENRWIGGGGFRTLHDRRCETGSTSQCDAEQWLDFQLLTST